MHAIQDLASGLTLGPDGIWYAGGTSPVSYPADRSQFCYQIEDRSFWFRHRNRCIAAAVAGHPPPEGSAIVDIGGGNGFVTRALIEAGFDAILMEPGPAGARHGRDRGIDKVICASVDAAGLIDGAIGAIGLFDVVEHVSDDREFMTLLARKVRPGGRLYATVPAYSMLWSREDEDAGHYRRYTLGRFCDLLADAGFGTLYSTYLFRWLPGPIFLLRSLPFRLGLGRRRFAAGAIRRQHGVDRAFVGRCMNALFEPEVRRIREARTMHFGSSCLVVAERIA